MKRRACLSLVTLFGLACASAGGMPHAMGTSTNLTHANFRVLKANAIGRDRGFSLLGFIPIVPASVTDAMTQLQTGVKAEGRSVTLANVTQERRSLYLILFSLPEVVIRADVIEFIDESSFTE